VTTAADNAGTAAAQSQTKASFFFIEHRVRRNGKRLFTVFGQAGMSFDHSRASVSVSMKKLAMACKGKKDRLGRRFDRLKAPSKSRGFVEGQLLPTRTGC
jgi:hypothetical protein